VQLAAAVKHVRSIVKALGIPRERVVRHAEIDPDNRSDPRELAWQALLDDIYEVAPMLDTAAFGDWMQQHVIPQNPAAAFYAYGRAQGWEPISGEHDWQGYRAQVWYSPADQKQHIVYARIGDWGNVKHFDR
jgi:N-acetyl-anhydromuramyl-L-alanine amidase AmpD